MIVPGSSAFTSFFKLRKAISADGYQKAVARDGVAVMNAHEGLLDELRHDKCAPADEPVVILDRDSIAARENVPEKIAIRRRTARSSSFNNS